MTREDVAALLASHDKLVQHLEWFKQQLFGSKSERRLLNPDARQLALGEWGQQEVPATEVTVGEHQRRTRPARSDKADVELRFDESVPVEEILLPAPGVDADAEIVGQKVTLRLAQRPSSRGS